MIRMSIAVLLSSVFLPPLSSQAVNNQPIEYISDWRLFRAADHCFLRQKLTNGVEVSFLYYSKSPEKVIILFNNPAWKSLIVGSKVPIVITYNAIIESKLQGVEWSSEGNVRASNSGPYLALAMSFDDISSAFAGTKYMAVTTEGKPVAFFPLGGSTPNIKAVQCSSGLIDPFASANGK